MYNPSFRFVWKFERIIHARKRASLLLGLHQHLKGPVGLFFTDSPPEEVKVWFDSFSKPDFARAGNQATKEIVLPVGEHSTSLLIIRLKLSYVEINEYS